MRPFGGLAEAAFQAAQGLGRPPWPRRAPRGSGAGPGVLCTAAGVRSSMSSLLAPHPYARTPAGPTGEATALGLPRNPHPHTECRTSGALYIPKRRRPGKGTALEKRGPVNSTYPQRGEGGSIAVFLACHARACPHNGRMAGEQAAGRKARRSALRTVLGAGENEEKKRVAQSRKGRKGKTKLLPSERRSFSWRTWRLGARPLLDLPGVLGGPVARTPFGPPPPARSQAPKALAGRPRPAHGSSLARGHGDGIAGVNTL